MPYIAHISLLVRDYDEAIAFYTTKLGFTLVQDKYIPSQNKRWVTIRPPGGPSGPQEAATTTTTTILLARASSPDQLAAVGKQSGENRVFLFLATDDFERDFERLSDAGVEWARSKAVHDYGTVAVFKDLYGNLWDLIQFADEA
jgi:catechol 2,3-dioxygenase-like lactoylglutathione lyase family enzyme